MVISEAARSDAPSLVGSAVKLVFSDLYERCGRTGIRLLGRSGLAREDLGGLPAAELLHHGLWSIQFGISGGTTQIQKNIIAERVLGQPKDR